MFRRGFAVALLYAVLAAGVAEARPGDLDQAFGLGGFVSTDFGDNEPATDVALQPNGKIVAVGGVTGVFSVARYNPDGSLDSSFGGGDGLATAGFGAPSTATSVAIQPDGKIVLAGATLAGPSPSNFALVRLEADGSPDAGFDGDGLLFTDFGADEFSTGLVVGAGGRITAVGGTATAPGAVNFAFARYEADGSPDNSFDGDGLRTINFGALDAATDTVLQPDGRIVAAGLSISGTTSRIALARLTPAGAPDPSLLGTGLVLTDLGDGAEAEAVTLQPDGRIVVSGAGPGSDFAMVRYRPDGTLDPSFGNLGAVLRNRGTSLDVAIQPDGKIVALSGPSFGVTRFNPDGSDDAGFGQGGYAAVDFGDNSFATALALQPDGRVVAAGITESGANPENFGLVRLLGGGPVGPSPAPPGSTCKGRAPTIVADSGGRTKGTPGDDVIVGTPSRDRIKAGRGNDVICGLGGRSRVDAGGGRDLVVGGNRRDVLRGGGGPDQLRGKGGNDRLLGGGGADRLVGGKGRRDHCAGGPGRDRARGCGRD